LRAAIVDCGRKFVSFKTFRQCFKVTFQRATKISELKYLAGIHKRFHGKRLYDQILPEE